MPFEIDLTEEDRVEYVVDFGTNRELAESWDGTGERPFFWVELLPLSGRDYQKTRASVFSKASGSQIMARSARLVRRVIEEYVPVVGDCLIGGKPVTTGKELWTMLEGAPPVYSEITDDIFGALQDNSKAAEGDLKKLQARCGSSAHTLSKPQLLETGNAPNAQTTTTPVKVTYTEKPETATG